MAFLSFPSAYSMGSSHLFGHIVAYPFDLFILKHRNMVANFAKLHLHPQPEMLVFVYDQSDGDSHYAVYVARARTLADLLFSDWPHGLRSLDVRLSMTAVVVSSSLCGEEFFGMAEEALFLEEPWVCNRCAVLLRQCDDPMMGNEFQAFFAAQPISQRVLDVQFSIEETESFDRARFFQDAELPRGPLLRPWVPNARGTPEEHAMNTLKSIVSEVRRAGYSNEWITVLKSAYSTYPEHHPYILAIQAFSQG